MKKRISFLIAALMAASSLTSAAAAGTQFYGTLLYGDANLDHEVNVVDATAIQRFSAGILTPSDLAKKASDVNNDNEVNVSDATCVQRFAAGLPAGCGDAGKAAAVIDPPDTEPTPEEVKTQGSAALTGFSVRLLQSSMQHDDNTLLSPLSVMEALGMTSNGAKGRTRSQMEATLGAPRSILNSFAKAYPNYKNEYDESQLSIANSLWTNTASNLTVSADFKKSAEDYYDADVFSTVFDEQALKNMNEWMNKKTNGMIPSMLDRIEPTALMYLMNAVAFEADWEEPYVSSYKYHNGPGGNLVFPGDVKEGVFTSFDGSQSTVEYMCSEERYYFYDDNAQGFIKPYTGGSFAFAAILPNEGVKLDDYVASLTGEKLTALLESKHIPKSLLYTRLPKFEVKYGDDLVDNLQELGMTDAFNSDADLTDMIDDKTAPSPYISKVLHKTFIAFNELGTRAGAGTVVEVKEGAPYYEEPPKYVYLERPFLYMIINTETNTPLFIGTVQKL